MFAYLICLRFVASCCSGYLSLVDSCLWVACLLWLVAGFARLSIRLRMVWRLGWFCFACELICFALADCVAGYLHFTCDCYCVFG